MAQRRIQFLEEKQDQRSTDLENLHYDLHLKRGKRGCPPGAITTIENSITRLENEIESKGRELEAARRDARNL